MPFSCASLSPGAPRNLIQAVTSILGLVKGERKSQLKSIPKQCPGLEVPTQERRLPVSVTPISLPHWAEELKPDIQPSGATVPRIQVLALGRRKECGVWGPRLPQAQHSQCMWGTEGYSGAWGQTWGHHPSLIYEMESLSGSDLSLNLEPWCWGRRVSIQYVGDRLLT